MQGVVVDDVVVVVVVGVGNAETQHAENQVQGQDADGDPRRFPLQPMKGRRRRRPSIVFQMGRASAVVRFLLASFVCLFVCLPRVCIIKKRKKKKEAVYLSRLYFSLTPGRFRRP